MDNNYTSSSADNQYIYYVYAYLREDGSPYYIGKGKNSRAFDVAHRVSIPKKRDKIIFLETNLSNIGALALERRYISWYGRKDNNTGILRNLTDGGDGSCSVIHSEETKQKIAKAKTGKTRPPFSETHKEKISVANKGKKRTKEVIRQMSDIRKGKLAVMHTPETKRKISEYQKNRKRIPHSEAAKEKMSIALKKAWETRKLNKSSLERTV
jgi:hypothetical protein